MEEETREAAKREKERLQRIEERKKLMEQLQKERAAAGEDDKKPEDTTVQQVVLDMDKETKKTLVEVNPVLVDFLKPHQVHGIKFLYDNTIESLESLKNNDEGHGCVLAHSMGLGKTLQVIAYIHALLSTKEVNKHIKSVLIVVPVNVLRNWGVEFNKWLFENNLTDFLVWELTQFPNREQALKEWHKDGEWLCS